MCIQSRVSTSFSPPALIEYEGKATYIKYGPDGTRLKKIVVSGAPTETTLYLGADVSIDPTGTYTIHIHPDVKRVANDNHYLHHARFGVDQSGVRSKYGKVILQNTIGQTFGKPVSNG